MRADTQRLRTGPYAAQAAPASLEEGVGPRCPVCHVVAGPGAFHGVPVCSRACAERYVATTRFPCKGCDAELAPKLLPRTIRVRPFCNQRCVDRWCLKTRHAVALPVLIGRAPRRADVQGCRRCGATVASLRWTEEGFECQCGEVMLCRDGDFRYRAPATRECAEVAGPR